MYKIYGLCFSLQHTSLKLSRHSTTAVQRKSQPSLPVCLFFTHFDVKMLNDRRIQSSSHSCPAGCRQQSCCSEGGILLCWAPKRLLVSDQARQIWITVIMWD